MAAHNLPSAYQEVEYLESSGTQYINTCLNTSTDTELEADISLSVIDSRMLWANNNTVANRISCFLSNTGNSNFGNKTLSNNNLLTYFILNTKTNVKENAEGIFIDGTKRVNFNNEGTISNGDTMYIFTAKNTGATGLSGNMYNCTIKQNGTLMRNFIPCYRKSDLVAGMYDIANNVFYTNQGTGSFIVGPPVQSSITTPTTKDFIYYSNQKIEYRKTIIIYNTPARLPLEYQEVDYIQAGNLAYIFNDGYTQFNLTNSHSIDAEITLTTDSYSKAGLIGGNKYNDISVGSLLIYNNDMVAVFSNKMYKIPKSSLQLNKKLSIHYDINSFTADENVGTAQSGEYTESDIGFYIARAYIYRDTYYSKDSKFHYVCIKNNGVKVLELIPCYKKSDNAVGMYDLVNSEFFQSGVNPFTKGSDYYKKEKLETIKDIIYMEN